MTQSPQVVLPFDPSTVLILNVDDQEAARYAKTRVLQKAGYTVVEAENGHQALEIAAGRLPDTIMLDVNLPDVNGFDVCRQLKSDPRTTGIPIVQVSASFTTATDQAVGLEGGADAYLTAPTDPRVLVGTIRAMVRIRNAEKHAAELLARERDARLEAERLGRLKDEFLATLSHELRTPLNAVIGWATILRKSPGDVKEVMHGVEVIERNARAQSALIAELLDMSRILAGKTRLELSSVDAVSLARNAVETARPLADARAISLRLEGCQECWITADSARMQQVLANLIGNALKFTPRGGRVDVSVQAENGACRLEVRDTGEGISPAFLPHVFERFRQGDASTSRRHGGLGIGLAIVKHLATMHGGSVAAQSAGPGQGSTFTVTIPRIEATPRNAASRSGERSEPAPDLAGVRVLVVDDEPDAREVTVRMLMSLGATVEAAANAEQALSMQLERPSGVIVSDIGMPGTDGYGFLRALRASGDLTPAIALTAFARDEDGHRAAASGYTVHIPKPFDVSALAAAVYQLGSPSAR